MISHISPVNIKVKHVFIFASCVLIFYTAVNTLSVSLKFHEIFNSIFSVILTFISGGIIFCLYRITKQNKTGIYKSLFWLSLSFLSWFIADCLWLLLIAIGEYPFPSLADFFYFAMYPTFIIAIFNIPSNLSPFKGTKRIIIEISILILSAILFFLFLVIVPGQKTNSTDNFSLFITYLYPVIDVAIIWIILIRFFSNQLKSSKKVMRYFIGGIVCFTLSDLVYFIDSLHRINDPGYFTDLGYYIFYFIILVAALIGSREVIVKIGSPQENTLSIHSNKWLTFLPGVFLISVVGFILFFVFNLSNISNFAVIVVVSLIFGLFILHQYLVVKENIDLNIEMCRVNIELERKVLQRTAELKNINKELHTEITFRKRTEEILKQSEEKYRLIAENTSDVIWVMDSQFLRFKYISPSVFNLTGYSVDELFGKSIRELYTQQSLGVLDKLITLIDHHNAGEINLKTSIDELQVVCKNGQMIWIEMATTLITNNENIVTEIISVSRNIEQRKKAESQIQQKNLQLEELNATKDKFFSIIAHDLKSPFGSIVNLSETLCFNINDLKPESIKSFAIAINYSAKLTFKLLENLLEWSKLQRENLKLNTRYINFKSIVDEIILLNTEMAVKKNINIENNIGQDIYINCDVEVTKSILRNLVSNALKFTNSDGAVTINIETIGLFNEIKISDTGVGIPPEKIPYLFSIEQDVSTIGTDNERGTGLGLLLCKELVEKQGGTIWVRSTVGRGSSFFFTIPVQRHQIFIEKT